MPRQSRGRSSSSSRSAPKAAPAQARGAHTAAAPAGHASPSAPAPPAAAASGAQQPGILGQIASTAAGVAIGSTVGHGISSMLFGGGQAAAPPAEAAQGQQASQSVMSCEQPAKDFTLCLEKADMQSCSYYLEQLNACQAAAKPY
ncbi:hypothetical protein C8F01DRAFT_786436 [Mycena amicta]|nr:hypothetical protein C8F01DRAFT_786436 [Mycena amicta]